MTDHAEATLKDRIEEKFSHRGLGVVVAITIIAIAIYVLHHLVADVPWHQVKADLFGFSTNTILLALAFTALSFVALSIYDVLAVEIVAPGKVPHKIAALVGACGYAVSNLLGFSYLTGGALRFRVYSSLGLDWSLVAGVIATSWFSLWLGITLLLGFSMVVYPEGIGSAFGLSSTLDVVLGILLLAAMAGVFWWLSRAKRRISRAGFELNLPTARMASLQSVVAVADMLGACLALYVLLPGDLTHNFPFFFVVYISAIGLGILSHAPGGIGVFEATIIAALGAGGRSDVVAALVMYRFIYYLTPFVIAVAGMAVAYLLAKRAHASKFARILYAATKPLVAPVAAGIALVSGVILLISGNLPAEPIRHEALNDIVPLPFVEFSHLMGSIAGMLLIVVANGLYRKQARAWFIAVLLVAIGFFTSLLKGFDWEEAVLLAVALGFLLVFRSVFYRAARVPIFRMDMRWLLGSAALIAAATWVGFFAYSNVPYNNDLWWQFAWNGDASRFLRGSLVIAVLFCAIGLNSVINARQAPLPPEPIPDRVRELVAQSPDTEANISLSGDKRFLLSDDERAFIAYADSGGSLIAKSDPVGAHDAGEAVIWKLRELADRLGKRCAFYSVSAEYLPTYLDMGLSILKIGEVGRVDLTKFTLETPSKRKFRQAYNRAMRDGYRFEIIKAADLAPVLPELKAISDAWLELKQGEEKGFALGGFTDAYMSNFDQAVLRDGESGRIVAFANLFQGAEHHELSLDLMRYQPGSPGFVMDALFAAMLLWGHEQGFKWFSLGPAPFSGMQDHPLASVWNRVGTYVYRHGEHFYHFEGLRDYKQKFDPVWSPNYLASPRGFKAPLVLYEVNVLVSGGVAGLMK